jgi:hypothetical protein
MRAGALVDLAHKAVKSRPTKPCGHCGEIPRGDREEYLMDQQLKALSDKCRRLAGGSFGGREIGRVNHGSDSN